MKKKDIQGIIIIIIVLAVLILAGIATTVLKPSTNIDEKTLCLTDEKIQFQKVIIIDKSDRWNSDSIAKMNNWLFNMHQGVPAQNRLTVLSIVGDGRQSTEIKTLFDKCSPGSEKECNELYENCRRIKNKYNDSFKEPLRQITELLSKPGEASYSPLFETLVQVIDDIKSEEAEIHIVSDFMENGYKFSFYDLVPLAEDIIKEYPLVSNSKITIHIHMIERRRHSRVLLAAVKAVWKEYFTQQGINMDSERLFISD